MTDKITTLAALLALTSLGCGTRTLIGEVDGAAPNDLGAGSVDASGDAFAQSGGPCAPLRDPNDRAFAFPAGVAGTWTGTYQPRLGGVQDVPVKLILDQAGDGSDQIHLVFGTKPPPAPATDPGAEYLPGWWDRGIVEGFPYLAHQVLWHDQEVRFALAYMEPWDSWCRLQRSYPQGDGITPPFKCLPNVSSWSTNGAQCVLDTTPPMTWACYQAEKCASPVCACDTCGCAGSPSAASELVETITFAGDTASGLGLGGHFTRTTN